MRHPRIANLRKLRKSDLIFLIPIAAPGIMAAPLQNAPVQIIKKRSNGHKAAKHGGAWKVAYADFMTALMAFFLLLWILSVSDQNKLKGIADYFTPSDNPMSAIGGTGLLGGNNPDQKEGNLTQDAEKPDQKAPIVADDGKNSLGADDAKGAQGTQGGMENPWDALNRKQDHLGTAAARVDPPAPVQGSFLTPALTRGGVLADLQEEVRVQSEKDGTSIDILDLVKAPMFESASDQPSDNFKRVIKEITNHLRANPNITIEIVGHTDNRPYKNAKTPEQDNWSLSIARATATQRAMIGLGVDANRFRRIAGAAASEPIDPAKPDAADNRRVTIRLYTSP